MPRAAELFRPASKACPKLGPSSFKALLTSGLHDAGAAGRLAALPPLGGKATLLYPCPSRSNEIQTTATQLLPLSKPPLAHLY